MLLLSFLSDKFIRWNNVVWLSVVNRALKIKTEVLFFVVCVHYDGYFALVPYRYFTYFIQNQRCLSLSKIELSRGKILDFEECGADMLTLRITIEVSNFT